MNLIAVTQRVGIDPSHGERRDMLDQRWASFLHVCGLTLLPAPNNPDAAIALIEAAPLLGLLLTGGNDLVSLGGDAPERDETERRLVEHMIKQGLPILGICRGAQLLIDMFGGTLERVEGHIATRHSIFVDGKLRSINSFHGFGTRNLPEPLLVEAVAHDGVIEAFRHADAAIHGRFWHPERNDPFDPADIGFFRSFYGASSCKP